MKINLTAILMACALSACSPSGEEASAPVIAPTASVKTAKLEKARIAETITAYGSVIAQPDELESLSVQYESKMVRLLVTAGEPVAVGQALIEVDPSPDAVLLLGEAKSAAEFSEKQLEETRRRFDMKLAVNQELQQAIQSASDAKAKLTSLEARGSGERAKLQADLAGIVSTIDVRIGQIVTAGSQLLSIVPDDHIEVHLGVEPNDAASLKAGAAVDLVLVSDDSVQISGKIRLITRRVNPQTRLVDTFVSVAPDARLLLDGYVRGRIEIRSEEALVAPRSAVLPDKESAIVFTVLDGHAVEHKVTTGLESDTHTAVISDTLKVGDALVITGNYVLEDGMAVTISASE
jgi:membrane fusion protein (multidrug efflux system)